VQVTFHGVFHAELTKGIRKLVAVILVGFILIFGNRTNPADHMRRRFTGNIIAHRYVLHRNSSERVAVFHDNGNGFGGNILREGIRISKRVIFAAHLVAHADDHAGIRGAVILAFILFDQRVHAVLCRCVLLQAALLDDGGDFRILSLFKLILAVSIHDDRQIVDPCFAVRLQQAAKLENGLIFVAVAHISLVKHDVAAELVDGKLRAVSIQNFTPR